MIGSNMDPICLSRRRAALVLGLLAAFTATASAAGLPTRKIREIQGAVSAEMDRLGVPGLTAALGVDLQPAWSQGFGMADLENSVPARTSTMYRLGSISKPITAVAVMQLVERGKLDLDAPIQKYVPSFPEKDWPITARMLLAHIAGIRHYRGLEEVNSTRHFGSVSEPLVIFAPDPLAFEPGTKYLYTTYGYCLLGAAVEGASGIPYMRYVGENIFRPAEMERIRPDAVYEIIPSRARGYRKSERGRIQNCALADTSNKIPGGGMISTADDLVKFAIAFDRGTLVGKRTVSEMTTRQCTRDRKPVPYGLGWSIDESQGKMLIGHGGAQQGISTYLLNMKDEGVVVALMANLEGIQLRPLAVRIAEIVRAGAVPQAR